MLQRTAVKGMVLKILVNTQAKERFSIPTSIIKKMMLINFLGNINIDFLKKTNVNQFLLTSFF